MTEKIMSDPALSEEEKSEKMQSEVYAKVQEMYRQAESGEACQKAIGEYGAFINDHALMQESMLYHLTRTSPEAEPFFDLAQAMSGEESDVNAQVEKMYVYLFPNEELRERAHAERKRRSKIMTPIIIILGVMSIAALVVFLRFGLMGYPLPVMFTLLLGGTALLSACTGGKLKAIESEQKRELESKPEYSKHLEWYNLNYNSQKIITKIYYICLAFALVIGWVLGVLFPYDAWSLFAFLPILIFIAVNNKMVKDMRQKVIPIENEIDRQNAVREDACADTDVGENAVDEFKGDIDG